MRYRNHYYMASGIHAGPVAAEFLAHSNEEQIHADWVAERITHLGGVRNLNPDGLATRSHAEYKKDETLEIMIQEDLVKQEEEHADDLANLLRSLIAKESRVGDTA